METDYLKTPQCTARDKRKCACDDSSVDIEYGQQKKMARGNDNNMS